MSPRLHDERGATLISSVLIVFMMLGFGLALLAASDTQSKTSARERTRESSFNLAEAAMNAHALQLTRSWPDATSPSFCTPTTTAAATCPQPEAIAGGYTGGDYGTPCASSASTPAWRSAVRDSQGEQYWTSNLLTSRASYDADGDGAVWLRTEATAQCHTVAVVTQVSQSSVAIPFPSNVVTTNWFATANQGKKVVVDTRGSGSQPAGVVARCTGMSTAACLNYDASKGQIEPPAVRADSSAASTTLSDSQLASLQSQAVTSGSYYAGCPPATAAALSSPANGAPVYVKNCPLLSVDGTLQINSPDTPGALIIENGTISVGGAANFYGLVYMANKQGSSGAVMTVSGNAQIWGIVAVDGLGGIIAGSSKTNLVNDPRASTLLKGSSGAKVHKNTFRVVPTS